MIEFCVRITSALALVFALLVPGSQAHAQTTQTIAVDQWSIYGTSRRFVLDGAVPGGGAVTIAARAEAGEEWSSAASVPLPQALRPRERISAIFWARADRPTKLPVMMLARVEPHASFARSLVELTPAWQRIIVTGAAPSDLAAGSQALSIRLGKAGASISLGPVLWMRDEPGSAQIDAALAASPPVSVAQDVRVASESGVSLAATLRIPRGQGPGPFPVTLLLAGNGAAERGLFSLLADRLLAQGIATFEYDKRGVGQSTGEFVDAIPLMRTDAAAAVAYLRTRPDIDEKRIAVLGLSQGAVVGPALASRDPAIAAVVMLAGPVGARSEPFMTGLRARLAESGKSQEAIERIEIAVQWWMEARSRGVGVAEIDRLREGAVAAFVAGDVSREQAQGMVSVLDTPALLSMYEAAPGHDLAKVRAPVLVVFAEKDEVLTVSSIPQARAALKDNGDATVVEVPGVNHGFQLVEGGGTQQTKEVRPAVSAPALLDLVTRWLNARLHRVNRVVANRMELPADAKR